MASMGSLFRFRYYKCKLYCDGVLQTVSAIVGAGVSSPAAYTESLSIGGDKAASGSYFEGKIDEFAVFDRELKQDEITRMYNTYYTPNRVANGNFAQIGNEEVSNGDFSEISSEKVSNGDFATDSDWTKGTGITISGGSANFTGIGGQYLNQNMLTSGKIYYLSFDVKVFTSGALTIFGGAANNISSLFLVNSTGTYTGYFTAGGLDNRIFFGSAFIGSIDNVSIKEVGQDWTFSGWNMGDNNQAVLTGTGQGNNLFQQALTQNDSYEAIIDVVVTQGSVRVMLGGGTGGYNVIGEATSTGTFTYYGKSSGSGNIILLQSGNNSIPNSVKINSIKIKEVGQNWTLGAGTTIENGVANITVASSGGSSLSQSGAYLTLGKNYRITFTISNYSSGSIALSNLNPITYRGANGTYTLDAVGGNGVFNLYSNAFVGSVDNIVVQELKSDATNLMLNAGAYQSANPLITSTKSMEFDGVDDYLSSTGRAFGTDNVSVACWINLDAWDNYDGVWSNRNNTGTNIGFQCRTTGTVGNIELFADFGSSTITSTATGLSTSKWHYIVCTMDRSGNQVIYLDGFAKDTDDISTHSAISMSNVDVPFFIGKDEGNAEADGNITEFGIWDRVLTDLEVASLYNQGMPTNLLVNRNNYQSGNPTVFNTKQVDFDGVDDRLIVNNAYGSFTGSISYWLKRDNTTNDQYVFDARGAGSGSGFAYFANGSTTINAGGTLYVNGVLGNVVATGVWNHIVQTGYGFNINQDIKFGSRFTSANVLNGKISQAGLWNTTLTANEVSSLYNHGLPVDLNTNQAAYTSSSNLVGYWRMGSGTLDSFPLIADQTNATLGSELVTNGDFATDSNWTKGTGWSIANGKATTDGTINTDIEQNFTETGKTYYYSVTYSASDTFSSRIRSGATGAIINIQEAGTYNGYFIANGVEFEIVTLSDNTISYSIDNVSVKEVNGNPAIMTNQTASDIENGSPYAQLLQSSDFSSSTGWSNYGTISFGTNLVTIGASSNSGIFQDGILTNGLEYKGTINVTSYDGVGLAQITNGSGGVLYSITETGIQTFTFTHAIASSQLIIRGMSNALFSVSSVSITEVNTGLQGYWKMGDGINDEYPVIYDQTNPTFGANQVQNNNFDSDTLWNKEAGWTISGGKLIANTSSVTACYQAGGATPITSGKTYKVQFEITDYTNGSVNLRAGTTGAIVNFSTIGVHSTTMVAGGALQIRFASTGVTSLSIDNVSVKEVQGNPATMTNMVEGNITNQYPLTKIRNYYRMGDGILDGFPIIQDQTSPNLAHIPTTNLITYSEDLSVMQKVSVGTASAPVTTSNYATAPDGTQTATRVVFNLNGGTSTGDRSLLRQQIPSSLINFYSIYVKSTDGTEQTIIWHDGGEYSQTTVTNEWVRIFYDARINTVFAGIALRGGLGANTSDILAWGFQAEEQTQATAYLKSDGVAAVRKATTTNLLPYSEDFENAAWTKYKDGTGSIPVLTANNILSPDGLQNGTKIVYNAGSGTSGSDQSLITDSVSVPNNSIATVSIYLKGQNGGEQILLRGVAVSSYKLLTLTTEWQRFSTTENSGTTNDAIEFGIRQSVSGHGVINSSATIYAWGAQIEQQTQAETYAKTTGLPVTIDLFTENNYGTMTNMVAGDIVLDTPNNPA